MNYDALHIDFESYGLVDLKSCGLGKYAADNETFLHCMAWAFGDDDPSLWSPGDELPGWMDTIDIDNTLVVAHNAAFEWHMWNGCGQRLYGFPELPAEKMVCTMARAYAMSLPGALDGCAAALNLDINKDKLGKALMLKICKPLRWKDGVPINAWDVPTFTCGGKKWTFEEALVRVKAYCQQDVRVEQAIDARLLHLSKTERKVYTHDLKVNQRGVPFDMRAVRAGIEAKEASVEQANAELEKITDGAVSSTTALPALKKWLVAQGFEPASLDKNHIARYLEDDSVSEKVKSALRCRAVAGRATSAKKLDVVERANVDGRVRCCIQYHGAHTGRYAGRLVQPHNLPRDLPENPHEFMAALVEDPASQPLELVSQYLRAFIMAPEGHQFMGADFSAIESIGLAWLSYNDRKLELYRAIHADPDHPDVYMTTYGEMFGVDPTTVAGNDRQVGKTAELAFGFGGGKGAFAAMGETYGVYLPEDEAELLKKTWRKLNAPTVNWWYDLERAALDAVRNPGRTFRAGMIPWKMRGSFLFCRLPSGRLLSYPYPEIHRDPDFDRDCLTYKTVPSPMMKLWPDKSNSGRWARVPTFGGKLAENITQAACRDVLAEKMLMLEYSDYEVVLHVHDEVVTEGCYDERDLLLFQNIMEAPVTWAPDMPIQAKAWLDTRYIK